MNKLCLRGLKESFFTYKGPICLINPATELLKFKQ